MKIARVDAFQLIKKYDDISRSNGESISSFIIREQTAYREMADAVQRMRDERQKRELEHEEPISSQPQRWHWQTGSSGSWYEAHDE